MPVFLARARGPRDVDVHPGNVADELLQEQPGRERAAPALAGVLEVGDLRLELLARAAAAAASATSPRPRAPPRPGTRTASASSLLMTPAVCGPSATMQAPVSVAKSSTASGLKPQPEAERVGEREPSFGVGVVDLDGLSVERTNARRRACTSFPTACSRCRPRARAPRWGASLRRRAVAAASTAAAPAMSVFMSSMPSLVLSDRPPESKVTPLPTRTTRRSRARRRPGEVNEARLLGAPLRDREEEAHAERGAGGAIEDLDGEPGARAPTRRRASASRVGVSDPRRLVDEIARARDGARRRARARERRGSPPPASTPTGGRSVSAAERGARLRSSVRYLSKR